jgi:4-amino-4-deoxy-L-arabinose transferase-like glycosyltransferase
MAGAALLLALGFGIQAHFFSHYPQPGLFGDPEGYFAVGQGLRQAGQRLAGGAGLAEALEPIRGALHFVGAGALYVALADERPRHLASFRLLLAGLNTLGMLGSFLLARRLSGVAGGLLALTLAAFHPSFATHAARLYPDPLTGCLFVWGALFYLKGIQDGRAGWVAGAGLALGLGLLVRAQIINYVLLMLPVVLLPLAWRIPRARRPAAAFALGCLPACLLWLAILHTAGGPVDAQMPGWNVFRPYYPYGFWQNMETDGWDGPYRLKAEPFYKAMEARAKDDPELLRSRPRQLAFTAGYVAARPLESLLLVLDNVYRLHDRPTNPYQWDYPFDRRLQLLWHRATLVLALAGAVVFISARPAAAGVYFVPLVLALLHGLSLPWSRYALPGLLILQASAGALLGALATSPWREPRRVLGLLGPAIAIGALAWVAAPRLSVAAPGAARSVLAVGTGAWLALPFLAAFAQRLPWRPALAWALCGGLASTLAAHTARDRRWHELELPLGGELRGVEQQIVLSPGALAALRSAPEAFVVFDLSIPGGDSSGLGVEIGGRALASTALAPTMPWLPEATATGGRSGREYPQWWAVPLPKDALPADEQPLRIRLTVPERAPAVVLRADRFRDQDRVYEGPSFGDWPKAVATKLEYDADYRIPVREPLASRSTRSLRLDGSGAWSEERPRYRIRVVTLAADEGAAIWQSERVPEGASALGFAAISAGGGRPAELQLENRPILSFPIGAASDFDVHEPPYRLCYRFERDWGHNPYGSYFLFGPLPPGSTLRLAVRFRTGMRDEPISFVLDRRRALDDQRAAFARCAGDAGARLAQGFGSALDQSRNSYPEDTGRWRVDAVY